MSSSEPTNLIIFNIHKSSMEKLAKKSRTKNFFVRVSNEWVSCIHVNRNFDDTYGYLMAMLQQPDQIQSDKADLFFREICDKNVSCGQRPEKKKL
jgi:hypothetical protein